MKPPKPLTPKQEAWVKAWLTNGYNAVLAYQTAYNTLNMQPHPIRREAQRVIDAPSVAARLKELREADPSIPEPTVILPPARIEPQPMEDIPDKADKQWLLSEAVKLVQLAKRTGNLNAVRSGLELVGKITGDLVDRKELRVVRTWSDLSDAEIDALAAGETIDATISDE